MVLIMSVNPGFGGQQFISHSYHKIKQLKKMALAVNPALRIEVDGGVSISNIAELARAGADTFVAGNAVFAADNPIDMIKQMRKASLVTELI